MSQQVKQIRAASRWRNWKAIAFPRITTPSGVPQSYARTVNGLFGDTADYRIDLVPIALGNGQLRLEVRSELAAAAGQQATDVAMEIGVDETLIIAYAKSAMAGPQMALTDLSRLQPQPGQQREWSVMLHYRDLRFGYGGVSNVYVIDLTLSDRALRVAGISQIDRFASRPRMISTGSLWRRRSR